MRHFIAMLRDERGATMVEYALVAAVIALPLLAFMTAISLGYGVVLNAAGTGLAALGTAP